jgi:hypothetical protein
VSTVNQRRCISSHLGASGTRGAAHASATGAPPSSCLPCDMRCVHPACPRACLVLTVCVTLRTNLYAVLFSPPADSKQLAEFWDGLGEAEKRDVMELGGEPNSEFIVRQARPRCPTPLLTFSLPGLFFWRGGG